MNALSQAARLLERKLSFRVAVGAGSAEDQDADRSHESNALFSVRIPNTFGSAKTVSLYDSRHWTAGLVFIAR